MACAACKIVKKGCKDNCCFTEFFQPQDTEMFQKLKLHYPIKLMRAKLSDANTTKEDKERLLQEWYVCINAKGKEKQAVASSPNIEKKELQASKCLFADLFSPEAKEIVEMINEQGMEMVETEVKLMLEKLCRKTDDEVQIAAQILLELKQGDQQ